MKKIFTLIATTLVALTTQAAITIHVQAEEAPYLWAWNAGGNIFSVSWPGVQLTEKKTVQGTEFWYYTFADDITTVNILFNNGAGKQTGDINGITGDRYFTYDGESTYTDVSEQYGVDIPDAEVTSLTIKGNHDGWATDIPFDVVEAGKTFSLTIDLSAYTVPENLWKFKIRPNAQDWVGFLGVTFDGEVPAWIYEAAADGNFEVDLEISGMVLTFTATWGGGKKADENWTFKAVAGTSGIDSVIGDFNTNAPRYNVAGQRVNDGYRGLVIQSGRKFVNK